MKALLAWEEYSEGYQHDGRARALQQWREKQEAEAFAKLCKALRLKRWQAEVRAEGGERLQRLRQTARWASAERRAAMTQQEIDAYNAEQRAGRLAAFKAAPAIYTCRQCGAQWCPLPSHRKGNIGRYCSGRCSKRWHRGPAGTIKRCTRCSGTGHNRTTCPKREATRPMLTRPEARLLEECRTKGEARIVPSQHAMARRLARRGLLSEIPPTGHYDTQRGSVVRRVKLGPKA